MQVSFEFFKLTWKKVMWVTVTLLTLSINFCTCISILILSWHLKSFLILLSLQINYKLFVILTFVLWSRRVILSVSINWLRYWKLSVGMILKTYYAVTDKHNNVSFEVIGKHYHWYHSLSYLTSCDTGDNVCLDLHNYHYSIYIY